MGIQKEDLYFGDEMNISSKNGRSSRGWSLKGSRCVIRQPFRRSQSYSVIGVCGYNGMACHSIKAGSIRRIEWRFFSLFVSAGTLPPGCTYIIDNCKVHKDDVFHLIYAYLQIRVWYLPAYFPQGNPIELIWRNVKAEMRSNRMRRLTRRDPVTACNVALSRWYNRSLEPIYTQCGY